MQFYAISPFFVVLFLKNRYWGLVAVSAAALLSCGGTFVGTYLFDWSAHSFDGFWVTKYSVCPVYCTASFLCC
jgi:peptidoglycan/LPS O-acetylase OafA/YrhL